MSTRDALLMILDQVDYTVGNCAPTEMVAAVLPREIIALAREALAASGPMYPIPLEELYEVLDSPFADSAPWYVPLKAWVDSLKGVGHG